MNKHFTDLLKACSVLPALVIMPAMGAYTLKGKDYNLNDSFPDGKVNKGFSLSENAKATFSVKNIDITTAGTDSGINTPNGTSVDFGGKETESITINAVGGRGINATHGGVAKLEADTITIDSHNTDIQKGEAIYIASYDDGNSSVELIGKTISLHSDNSTYGIRVYGVKKGADNSGVLDITATENLTVSTDADGSTALHAQEGAYVNIDAANSEFKGKGIGISVFSGSEFHLAGNTTIDAGQEMGRALATRGGSLTEINKAGTGTVKIDGNIDFNYYEDNSNDDIDANVDLTLSGTDSYWNGNTVTSYAFKKDSSKDESYVHAMSVTGMKLTLKDGATWNAAKIEDKSGIIDAKGQNTGVYYIALNNLDISNGTVNIKDDERGITVDVANVSDATFNGGDLHINEQLNVNGGTNVFASNIIGENGNAKLNVANGAVMNIGDAYIDLASINLDGTMIANLTDRKNPIINAGAFTGGGDLSLVSKSEGEYVIFGDKTFANTDVEIFSSLYEWDWTDADKTTIKISKKSVDDIAADNNLSHAAAQTVMNLTNSSSEKLNDFGVLVQEHLSMGDSAGVEHAHRAINPTDAAAIQSVAGHVQGTVTKLAAGRMALPASVGRAGGDVNATAGGVWAQGLINRSRLMHQFNGYTRGVGAGIDGTLNRVFTIGAGYAFNHSDIDLRSRDTDIDSNTVFVYGQYKPNAWYANAVLNYTQSKYEENGNALGIAVESDYKINSYGAQIATGYDFINGITPEAGLRYIHVSGDTYTNSLGIRNKIDDADYLTAVLGAKYATRIDVTEELALRPELRAAVKYDIVSDDTSSVVTMPGIDAYGIRGDRLNRTAGEFGVGMGLVWRALDIALIYDIDVRKDYTSQTGMIKARYNF